MADDASKPAPIPVLALTPLNPQFREDPYSLLAGLRENCPVMRDEGAGVFFGGWSVMARRAGPHGPERRLQIGRARELLPSRRIDAHVQQAVVADEPDAAAPGAVDQRLAAFEDRLEHPGQHFAADGAGVVAPEVRLQFGRGLGRQGVEARHGEVR